MKTVMIPREFSPIFLRSQSTALTRRLLLISGLLLALCSGSAVMAQHEMHNMSSAGGLDVTTMPADNAVLGSAPDSVMLHFASEMQLVKLVLKDSTNKFVDIGFRYRPVTGMHYMQNIPELAAADYYTVEWAVLDGDGKLTKGNFHFSFGSDAKPPTFYLDKMEHPQHIMSPDYRLLQ
ncbi:MAG: copper resistance protein CopC [Gammaproteobacteria bacterium]|nr:copper resistance protein CopC [Pseudomonadales bacterium]MCP5347904.1 copper resistance protein CopC [Pseudomonadales bacterium]